MTAVSPALFYYRRGQGMLSKEQKIKIIELRSEGNGSKYIARMIGAKRDAVRSFLTTKSSLNLATELNVNISNLSPKIRLIKRKKCVCKNCSKEYIYTRDLFYSRVFCTEDCKEKEREKKALNNLYSCVTCGNKFKPNGSQKYCSDECSYRKDNCVVCGKEFTVKITSKVKHCSLMCSRQKYRKTHEEYCNRLLKIHKGNITPITFYIGSDKDITMHCLLCNKQTTGIAHKFVDSLKRKGCAHCGPRLSLAEDEINEWLQQKNVKYVSQYRFIDNDDMSKLRYDFAILNEDDSVKMLIEYDGVQHFRVVDRFGGKDEYVTRKERDRIKDNYARDMGIKLIRINYKQRDNIDSILNSVIDTISPVL